MKRRREDLESLPIPASISKQEAHAEGTSDIMHTTFQGLQRFQGYAQGSFPHSYTKPCPLSIFFILPRMCLQSSSFRRPSQQAVSKGRLLPERAEWRRCHVSTRHRPRLSPHQKTTSPFWRSVVPLKGISPRKKESSAPLTNSPSLLTGATLKLTRVSC